MERFLQNMGPRNKNKALLKTSKLAATDKMAPTSPASSGEGLLPSQLEANEDAASDDFYIDYKRLATEVATRISPDIQETLAATVTDMFTKMQADIAQHEQRIEDLESRV